MDGQIMTAVGEFKNTTNRNRGLGLTPIGKTFEVCRIGRNATGRFYLRRGRGRMGPPLLAHTAVLYGSSAEMGINLIENPTHPRIMITTAMIFPLPSLKRER